MPILKRALIVGVSGQDGAYLAKFLLAKGYEVHGTSRDAQLSSFSNLARLGIKNSISCHSMAPNDFRSVLQLLDTVQPAEIYNLAGQSSVGLSFDQPVETLESIGSGTLNLLEAVRFFDKRIRLYNAGSSECFGDTGDQPADEGTPFRPRSPYAIAKSTSCWLATNYREAYNLFACNGILFNHESPLRPERFVTKKIVRTACRIASGSQEKLYLGDISIARDWGSAEEYVEAMWKILQHEPANDFVIATGETNTLQDFVAETFRVVGLNWRDHVICDPALIRPAEIIVSQGNPSKALNNLRWQANRKMHDVIKVMVDAEKNGVF